MVNFDTYREFLESRYKNWVPEYAEQHDTEPSKELLDSPCQLYAYTDYGGDFIERVICQFLQEYANEDNLCWQDTVHNGENVLYIGKPQSDDYALADFPDIPESLEDYYTDAEYKAEYESFQWFVNDLLGDRELLKRWALEVLVNERSGYYSLTSAGDLDYSYGDLRDWLFAQTRK